MTTWIAGLEDEQRELEGMIAARRNEMSPSLRLTVASLERRLKEVQESLQQATRPLVAVKLQGGAVSGHEIKIDTLGPFLDELQEVVSSIGQALRGSATAFSSIPKSIRDETALSLSAVKPGSVILELRSLPDPRVVAPPLIGEVEQLAEPLALEALGQLVDIAKLARRDDAGDDDLAERVAPLGARVYKHLEDLTRVIVEGGVEVDLAVTSPVDGPQSAYLGSRSAQRLRDVLRRIEVTTEREDVIGELRGASSVRNSFDLLTPGDRLLTGRVSSGLVPALRLWFERPVLASLEVSVAKSLTTGREYRRYLLVGLEEPPRHLPD